jgi:hypothetical protein
LDPGAQEAFLVYLDKECELDSLAVWLPGMAPDWDTCQLPSPSGTICASHKAIQQTACQVSSALAG